MLLNILILEVPSCIYIEYHYYRWDLSWLFIKSWRVTEWWCGKTLDKVLPLGSSHMVRNSNLSEMCILKPAWLWVSYVRSLIANGTKVRLVILTKKSGSFLIKWMKAVRLRALAIFDLNNKNKIIQKWLWIKHAPSKWPLNSYFVL